MEPSQRDWKISDLYQKSWQLVKNNKVLWIFGAAMGGFSLNSGSNYRTDMKDLQRLFNDSAPASSQISQVLGDSTTSFNYLFSILIGSIPPAVYPMLILEILLLIIVIIAISVITKAWAKAALLEGIQLGINNQPVSITESSGRAFSSIRSLIWLNIVPYLVLALLTAVIGAILVAGIALVPNALKIIFGLAMVAGIGAAIYWWLFLLLSEIWAVREVVIDKKAALPALKDGYKIARRKLWSMLGLGIVNVILSILVLAVPAGLIGVIAAAIIITNPGIIADNLAIYIPLAIPLIIALTIGFILISAIITAFKAAVWSFAYNNIRGKYDKE